MGSGTARTSPASLPVAGGGQQRVTSDYAGGIAPGAHLVNVRVLGAEGTGYTSSVIAGLDWALANRASIRSRS